MQFEVHAVCSRARLVYVLCAGLCLGCGDDEREIVDVAALPDAGAPEMKKPDDSAATKGCVDVEINGDTLVEHLADFTAEFKVGASYDRTLMLFGGMTVDQPNTPSRANIFGLDKVDARRMAEKYPDFYLCSSPGGQEAAAYIRVYDIVPATCKVHQQLVAALRQYDSNAARGGDRTSVRLEGAPLTVTSVTHNASGQDVSAQVSDQQFHMVTSVKQLTGESLVSFGTED